ncbi:MAG: GIY-YIG nuclease family protein [Deltaproteobacteria bacterium]|nr:GIY-YIG nuclease family protein [Deltaproteobacteria bacterium]
MAYWVYILQSEVDGSFYIGSTRDVCERIQRHNDGRSRYTKTKRPWKLVYKEIFPDRSSAVKREAEIKRKKKRTAVESLARPSHP